MTHRVNAYGDSVYPGQPGYWAADNYHEDRRLIESDPRYQAMVLEWKKKHCPEQMIERANQLLQESADEDLGDRQRNGDPTGFPGAEDVTQGGIGTVYPF